MGRCRRRSRRGLLPCLLLLDLRAMVADHATGRGAGDRMMSGNVPGHRSDRRTLQAALRRRDRRGQRDTQESRAEKCSVHRNYPPGFQYTISTGALNM